MKKEYILSLSVSMFMLCCIEILLQLTDYPKTVQSGWKYEGDLTETNQVGYRGQKVVYEKDDFVVLLLGDSQVTAKSNPFETLPEQLLEFHLSKRIDNVKVFTLGTDGYGQDQQLLALEKYYTRFRADVVLLWFTYYNDIWNNMFPTHNLDSSGAGPKPTFFISNGKLRGPSEKLGAPIDRIKLISLVKMAFRYNRDDAWEKHLPPSYSPFSVYTGTANPLWESDAFQENIAREKTHISALLTPASPRMQYGIKLTQKLLRKIDDLVEENGGRFVVVYPEHPWKYFLHGEIPAVRTVAETYFGGDQVYVWRNKYYKTSKIQSEQNLQEIIEGFPFYRYTVDIENCAISKTDFHFNQLANNIAMSQLAEFFFHKIFHAIPTKSSVESVPSTTIQERQVFPFYPQISGEVRGVGFSIQEPWGRWSILDTVMIEFRNMFPPHFSLTFEATSYNQQNHPFIVTIGDSSQTFRLLDGQLTHTTLNFADVKKNQSTIKITIPNPISPKSINASDDGRTLGIGIRSIEINPHGKNEHKFEE